MTGRFYISAFFLLCGLVLYSPVMAAVTILSRTGEPYTVSLMESGEQPNAGEPFFIRLGLQPQELPPGFFVSVLADAMEYPAGGKPEILPGLPTIRLTMPTAGLYRVVIRVSLVGKSSCAGVDASGIFEEELSYQVAGR